MAKEQISLSQISIPSNIKDVLQNIINKSKEFEIEKIILFGSYAKRNYRKYSDIDIATSCEDDKFEELKHYIDSEDFMMVTLRKVDLINLKDKNINRYVREEIEKYGISVKMEKF